MKDKISVVSKFNVLGGEGAVSSSVLDSAFSLENITKKN
jgi:hypothetical protein